MATVRTDMNLTFDIARPQISGGGGGDREKPYNGGRTWPPVGGVGLKLKYFLNIEASGFNLRNRNLYFCV